MLCAAVAGAEGTAAGARAEGGTMGRWKVPTVITKLNIDWPELQLAFESSFDEVSCYLARETGTVVTVTEDLRAADNGEGEAEGVDPPYRRKLSNEQVWEGSSCRLRA